MSQGEKIAQGLHLAFPVSSGTQHRDKEKEWVPVKKDNAAAGAAEAPAAPSTSETTPAAPATTPADVVVEKPPVPPEDKVFPDPPAKVCTACPIENVLVFIVLCFVVGISLVCSGFMCICAYIKGLLR